MGECKFNPEYMFSICEHSCERDKLAHAQYTKRCPLPNPSDAALAPDQMQGVFQRVLQDFPDLEPEQLSVDPPIVLFHNFFQESEIHAFLKHGKGTYEPSLGVGVRADGTIGDVKTSIRTSSHGWCNTNDCIQDPDVQRVVQRVANLTQTHPDNSEYAQLVYYHACETENASDCAFYKEHNDYIDGDVIKEQGVRIYTLFGYLNDVEEGGGTRFTRVSPSPITIQPRRGKALLWPSVLASTPHKKDDRTNHEALPVLAGEKFGANFWIHQHNFKSPHARSCI